MQSELKFRKRRVKMVEVNKSVGIRYGAKSEPTMISLTLFCKDDDNESLVQSHLLYPAEAARLAFRLLKFSTHAASGLIEDGLTSQLFEQLDAATKSGKAFD